MNEVKYLVNIVGPTAVGKTAVAIKLAKHFKTEIISSDSRQFYKEVSIGTAKPTVDELSQAPHHFINTLSVTEKYSAGDFERDALPLIEGLFKDHTLVIMVGGSGLYSKAVIEGLDKLPEGNEALREELHTLFTNEGLEGLQKRLKQISPDTFENTENQNPQRLMRAIEIAETPTPFKTKEKVTRPFATIQIGLNLPREVLYQRINERVDMMMQLGLLKEVESIVKYRDTYAMQTVGYKELFAYLDGELPLDKAIELIKQHTKWYEPTATGEIIKHLEKMMIPNTSGE